MDAQKSKFTSDEIMIKASPEVVWKVLTDPALTPEYMFGCAVACDWTIGSPILWKGVRDGITYVRGYLVAFEKPRKFSFSVFDPNAAYPDIPENYLRATYTLAGETDGTHLRVTQGDYAQVAEGEKRFRDSIKSGGWMPVLEGIKKIAETLS